MSVFFPPEEDKVPYLTFYDSQGKRKTKDIQLNSAKFSGAQKDHHPKYISIWLVNYPGSRTIEGGGETPFDLTGGPDAWTTSSKVHIDNVALSGFGSVIENLFSFSVSFISLAKVETTKQEISTDNFNNLIL